jgi:hypothetical protein
MKTDDAISNRLKQNVGIGWIKTKIGDDERFTGKSVSCHAKRLGARTAAKSLRQLFEVPHADQFRPASRSLNDLRRDEIMKEAAHGGSPAARGRSISECV